MARGGINKHHVAVARASLLQKGVHPSIDAVRKELGDTGSKTTISRYLREVEAEEGTQLADETLLSNTLKALVAKMASQLKQEASSVLEREKVIFTKQLNEKSVQINELRQLLATTEEQLSQKTHEFESSSSEGKALAIENTNLRILQERLEQQVKDQLELVEHLQSQVGSLEEKHQHSRQSLEHYRNSTQEQRVQDIRNHEQTTQHLHSEIRELRQTLSIKQNELTHLNADNARLVAQLSESQKSLAEQKKRLAESSIQLETKTTQISQCQTELSIEKKASATIQDTLNEQLTLAKQFKDELHRSELINASLQSEQAANKILIDQLIRQIQPQDKTEP